MWCELPEALGTAVADEADRLGVIVAPGPAFAVEGGLDRYLRIPWTRPGDVLEEAVRRLARAWERVNRRGGGPDRSPDRVLVA
jgi:DNA-binding transcriptional MocR family regulator